MNPLRAYRRARKAFKVFNTIRKDRKEKRAEKKRDKLEHEGVQIPKEEPVVKEFIVRKAKGAVKSSTVGVAGLIVALGGFISANPAILEIVPDQFKGVAIAGVGLLVALARLRTAGE